MPIKSLSVCLCYLVVIAGAAAAGYRRMAHKLVIFGNYAKQMDLSEIIRILSRSVNQNRLQ